MNTKVACAHCSAEQEVGIPDDYPGGALKWECAPCGGVNSTSFPAGPDAPAEELVVESSDVADVTTVLGSDGGGGTDK